MSTLTAPSTDLEMSATVNLQLAKVNVVLLAAASKDVNLINHVLGKTSPDVASTASNAFNPDTFVTPDVLAVVHSSIVNSNVPDMLLSGAPVKVTTPPLVVGSLKIGCDTVTLEFCINFPFIRRTANKHLKFLGVDFLASIKITHDI
jgi:hypothetical protein